MRPPENPPATAGALLSLSQAIAGFTLGELASLAGIAIPANLQRHKGWPGQLLEHWLGASAGAKPQQDFPELGIELKTIPIDANWHPLETTYVCYAPLINPPGLTWETSNVRNKLQRVMWVPVEGDRQIPLAERRVGAAFFWSPDTDEDTLLRNDWEEHTEMIVLGHVEKITARHGNVLQLRPKAANGSVLTDALGPDGARIRTRPRGFYLRKEFTAMVLQKAFS